MRLLFALLLVTNAFAEGPASTTHLWAPVFPQASQGVAFAGVNTLRCSEWVPEIGITGVTQFVFYITSALGAGTFCGAALYEGDGSTLIATTGAQDCSNAIAVGATGLSPFNLTGGHKYLQCICGSSAGGGYLAGSDADGTPTAIKALANSITPTIGLDAGAVCISGAPPAGPLTLSAQQTEAPFFLLATPTP